MSRGIVNIYKWSQFPRLLIIYIFKFVLLQTLHALTRLFQFDVCTEIDKEQIKFLILVFLVITHLFTLNFIILGHNSLIHPPSSDNGLYILVEVYNYYPLLIRGGCIKIFRRFFFSHSAENFRRGTLLCSVSENFK